MPGISEWIEKGGKGILEGLFSGASDIIKDFKADPNKVIEADQKLAELKASTEIKMQELASQAEEIAAKERENEDNNVSDRWKSDMMSDNKLSKSTRPIIVLSLLAFLFIIIITDSIDKIQFDVKPEYVSLLSTLLVTTIVAYFGSRGVEKFKAIHEMKNNK